MVPFLHFLQGPFQSSPHRGFSKCQLNENCTRRPVAPIHRLCYRRPSTRGQSPLVPLPIPPAGWAGFTVGGAWLPAAPDLKHPSCPPEGTQGRDRPHSTGGEMKTSEHEGSLRPGQVTLRWGPKEPGQNPGLNIFRGSARTRSPLFTQQRLFSISCRPHRER